MQISFNTTTQLTILSIPIFKQSQLYNQDVLKDQHHHFNLTIGK